MVKQFFKKKSKRVSCRTKYKIEKKVKEHNRKAKKESRKNTNKRKRKDPGIPNSLPFKDKILEEAAERKRRMEEERQKKKELAKQERQKLVNQKRNLGSLVKDAQKRGDNFNRKQGDEAAGRNYDGGRPMESSLKAYYKEFRKVVDAADVILEVLDARDPIGSRCSQVEEAVLSSGTTKRLVLVLNKIDLVPKENVEAWLKHLRNEFPTVAFKASTQAQSDNLSQFKKPLANVSEDMYKSSRCLGADVLMKLLGNYCRNKDIKTNIRVGIVGFPNTGKSSIINSLKRSRACNVGSTPGVTKQMQEINLDKHIKLLDSPGIVMTTSSSSDASIILRNCVKVETVDDPVPAVAAILKRCQKQQMMLQYGIPDFNDVNDFLAILAKRQGRLKKGGVPDVVKAGKTVLQDWNQGRITFYTHPPEDQEVHVGADIVSEMSKEFDIDSLVEEEKNILKGLKQKSTTDIVIDSFGPMELKEDESEVEEEMGSEQEEEEEEEEEEEMEASDKEEELKKVTVAASKKGKKKGPAVAIQPKKKNQDIEGLLQLNKDRKMKFKKMKKERRRADAVAGNLSSALEDAFSGLGQS